MEYAELILDLSHAKLDRIFSYRVPESMRDEILPGQRVLVPFGMGNKKNEAFVLGLKDHFAFDPNKVKEIDRILDPTPAFREDQLELAKYICEEYKCFLVDALRLMIPAELRRNRVHIKKIRTARLLIEANAMDDALNSLISKDGRCKAPIQRDTLLLLANCVEMSVKDLSREIPGAKNALAVMKNKGWIEICEHDVFRKPYVAVVESEDSNHLLTEEQKKAVEEITNSMSGKREKYLLRGVTGSGKTEVYMQCISYCIRSGKSAIMLVPEISLTPQTVERFRNRFGDDVAVLHSRLSSGERYDEWRRIRDAKVRVAIGARSAIFAPFKKIGLIVIDEEHESSYQSDKNPRYHARDIAEKRAEMHGASLLMGTATPGIESWYRAQNGDFKILTLKDRINGKELPMVEIVDMRAELAQGNRTMFSMPLYKSMKECYLSGQQMILFLNRRGYSTFVSCRSCGSVLSCESCDISMTYHKTDSTVRCHYCDSRKTIPAKCPECGNASLKHFGVGTQQVEEQVLKYFPGIKTIRMDYDTTRTKDAHVSLLQSFGKKEADVLIGTQMIAKGLDFPGVTLVGVIAADASLHVPDFRNTERCFQLLTQVAGRAGRDKETGKVIVQTYSPNHPCIQLSSKHDFEAFYEYEIECRKQNEFPPFADFVRFLFKSEDEGKAEKECTEFAAKLESSLHKCMEDEKIPKELLLYVSAHAAPLHYLRGEYRQQVIVKLKRSEHLKTLIECMYVLVQKMQDDDFFTGMEINPHNMT